MSGILENVVRYSPQAMILMVSNPVDVLTYQAVRAAGFGPDRGFRSGHGARHHPLPLAARRPLPGVAGPGYRLHAGRARRQHGAALTGANVAGIPLEHFPGYSRALLDEVIEATRFGGAEVIKRKGGTFYSVAPSIASVIRAVRWDLKQVLPISSLLDNVLGMNDMCLSLPCVVGKGGRERVLEPPLSDSEREALVGSWRVLREAADSVGLK